MALIDIEYIHTEKDIPDVSIRRPTAGKMKTYIQDLVYEMKSADISCSFKETIIDEGKHEVLINGRTIPEIIDGLEIRHLDVEESCDHGKPSTVLFGRPTLDWKKEYVEDVPDTIMKNAIAKVYADERKKETSQ
ncbi:MAG: hypothetical protein J6U12_05455 [Candidatus Methanomethylophilaceae archaeon]|jgi:hypothetical protein|nr:hypothetical protein [Candidatus Methanomethylophilaceae archaeon]MBP5735734.1 hypothetical protein [Candidatus Methanomethylophilaceae archaeon]